MSRARQRRFEPVEVRTAFALARVERDPRRPSGRVLLLGQQEASYSDVADPSRLEWSYVRRIGDVVDLYRPPRSAVDVVHVGGGAGTLARYVAATRPGSRQELYEIDHDVAKLAREHLGLRPGPRLRVRVGDGAALLRRRAGASADLVIGDAFTGPLVPPALLAPEHAAEVRRVLRPSGVYVVNLVDQRDLADAAGQSRRLRGLYAHVAAIAPRKVLRRRAAGNVILVASAAPLPLRALARRASASLDREQVVDAGTFLG